MGDGWNYSGTLACVRQIVGPFGRIWKRDGRVFVGIEIKGRKEPLGAGDTYFQAFHAAFLQPIKAREDQAARERECMNSPQNETPREVTAEEAEES